MPGVIRTRVGYSGGTTEAPTYRNIGDHTEMVEVDFNPTIISFQDIVDTFWANHNSLVERTYKGRQYLSILMVHDERQKQIVEDTKKRWQAKLGGTIQTEIVEYQTFHLAEDNHQKYYVKRYPDAIEKLIDLLGSPQNVVDSTIAARLNGFVKGYGTTIRLQQEIENKWGIDPINSHKLISLIKTIRW